MMKTERKKGSVCSDIEIIGFRNGYPDAELLFITNAGDHSAMRDYLENDLPEHWGRFDKLQILEAGDTRPIDVIQTERTWDAYLGEEDPYEFVWSWIRKHDAKKASRKHDAKKASRKRLAVTEVA